MSQKSGKGDISLERLKPSYKLAFRNFWPIGPGLFRRWTSGQTGACDASVTAKNDLSETARVGRATYRNPDRKCVKAVILAASLAIAACSAPAKSPMDRGPYETATGRGDGWGGNPPGL